MRTAIIEDTNGRWFVRGIFSSTHDLDADHMVYRCNTHLAGPFDDIIDAAHWVVDHVEGASEDA